MASHAAVATDPDWLLASFCIALSLHVAIVLMFPSLQHVPILTPVRVDVEFTRIPPPETPPQPDLSQAASLKPHKAEPSTPPARQIAAKPVSQPQQEALPLLTAKDDSQLAPQEPVVANIPVPASTVVTPSAPVNAPTDIVTADKADTAGSRVSSNTIRSDEADADEAWGYGQLLYGLVTKNKSYPQLAIRRHLQGKARISVRFSQGRLLELTLLEPGSGHPILDMAALEMMRKAVNALPIQGDLANKSFTVVIPIEFKIDG